MVLTRHGGELAVHELGKQQPIPGHGTWEEEEEEEEGGRGRRNVGGNGRKRQEAGVENGIELVKHSREGGVGRQ